ncbi:hypothetical protein EYC98_12775 [Halieaceae bacterium IMCC14734]|uniref:Uncharacterized protein n=1 Tax=Candidatus Litorirhabdus singularis TaxID=2518993 RepID=A0ABT3THD3_9GAMM|nr:hypothetical protein [Candidatus Litorirhabdus singularis]MCX2981733.1 hypothetical protein [Candidatus Litorirhabdus singularis]
MADSCETPDMAQSGDIMERLLSAQSRDPHPSAAKLDSLLYRDPATSPPIAIATATDNVDRPQTPDKNQVALEVRGTRANIRITIADVARQPTTMNKLADVAVKAIVNELRRGIV